MTADPRPVAFVGDSHLLAGDMTTEAFVGFVEAVSEGHSRLVLVGDIFDLWLARPHLHEDHHRRVLGALAHARSAGLRVDYAVGNRDFGVESWGAAPFDRVASETLVEDAGAGPPAWVAEHGDLVNELDLQYRRWRRLSRSAPVLGAFLRLPRPVGVGLSRWLERRLRSTNREHKRGFPLDSVIARARTHFAATGARFLVLGHFHEERRIAAPPGEIIVLPDWKRSRRHAEWTPSPDGPGTVRLVDSPTPR